MNKKEKLKKLYDQLNALDKQGGLNTDEISSVADSLIKEEVAKLTTKLNESSIIKTIQKFSIELTKFKKDFDLKPLLASIQELESEMQSGEKSIIKDFESKLQDIRNSIPEIPKAEKPFDASNLIKDISNLRSEFNKKIDERKSQLDLFTEELANLSTQLEVLVENDISSSTETKKEIQDAISKLRSEFLQRILNIGGGSMNRQIRVEGVDVLTKYTDINIYGVTSSVITSVDNVNKRVNIGIQGGGGGSTTLLTTTTIWVDGNRVDTYTATGTIQSPYKTISAAMTAITSLAPSAYVLYIAPGVYVENITASAFPAVIYGDGATIVGNVSLSKQFDIYDLNIIGNVTQSDTSLTVAHAFESSYIQGNISTAGLCFFYTMATDTSGVLTINAGSLCVIDNSQILDRIVNSGTLYFNASNIVRTDNSNYLIDSSASGSLIYISNSKFVNNGTGGGLNLSNNATTSPNEISSVDVIVGGTTNGITCGTANCILSDYNIFGSGGQIFATGSVLSPTARSGGIILAGNTSGRVIVAPASVAGTWTMALPTTGGSANQFLQTDGNGITSWGTPGASSVVSGITRASSIVTATLTAAATNLTDYAYFCAAGIKVTLPTAVGNTNLYTIKNTSASSVLIATTSAQTIDGSTTALLPVTNQSIDLLSDNAGWNVV